MPFKTVAQIAREEGWGPPSDRIAGIRIVVDEPLTAEDIRSAKELEGYARRCLDRCWLPFAPDWSESG